MYIKYKISKKGKTMFELNAKFIQSKKIDATDLDGEKVMMNLDLGKYFSLNSVGSKIWEIIECETSINEIVDNLLKEYDVDRKTCEESVVKFLERLKNEDLITIC